MMVGRRRAPLLPLLALLGFGLLAGGVALTWRMLADAAGQPEPPGTGANGERGRGQETGANGERGRGQETGPNGGKRRGRETGPNGGTAGEGAALSSDVASTRSTGSTPPTPPTRTGERGQGAGDGTPDRVKVGTRPPSAFGLPTMPGSVGFRSQERGNDSGSTAFRLKSGTAAAAVRFYVTRFGETGYELLWQTNVTTHPGGDRSLPPMRGRRLRWKAPGAARTVTLLALDDPQPTHTAQAVLSWTTP